MIVSYITFTVITGISKQFMVQAMVGFQINTQIHFSKVNFGVSISGAQLHVDRIPVLFFEISMKKDIREERL